MRFSTILSLRLLFIISVSDGANILSIFSTPTRSHNILGVRLAEGLIKKGHLVTLASPFPVPTIENLTHINLKSIYEFHGEYDKNDAFVS